MLNKKNHARSKIFFNMGFIVIEQQLKFINNEQIQINNLCFGTFSPDLRIAVMHG